MPKLANSQATIKACQEAYTCICDLLAHHPPLLELLSNAGLPGISRTTFETLLARLVQDEHLDILAERSPKVLFDDLINFVIRTMAEGPLAAAARKFRVDKKANKWAHQFVACELGLEGANAHRRTDSLKTVFVSKIHTPYPPESAHISEGPDVTAKWYNRFYKKKQADRQKKRWPIHELDSTKLQQTIPAHESCKIVDDNTGKLLAVVSVVWRDVIAARNGGHGEEVGSGDDMIGFMDWATKAVKDGLRGRRPVRVCGHCFALL